MMGILVVKELILSHNLGRFIKTPLEKPNIFNIFIICSGKSLNITSFNPIQDGYFRGCSRMGVTRIPPCPSKICHTYPTMMKLGTVIPYLKKIPKIYESRDTPPKFYWHQHFFTENQQILLYQDIQIKIAFWYNFSWVFKDFFNKSGYKFDDVSKNGYPRPS